MTAGSGRAVLIGVPGAVAKPCQPPQGFANLPPSQVIRQGAEQSGGGRAQLPGRAGRPDGRRRRRGDDGFYAPEVTKLGMLPQLLHVDAAKIAKLTRHRAVGAGQHQGALVVTGDMHLLAQALVEVEAEQGIESLKAAGALLEGAEPALGKDFSQR